VWFSGGKLAADLTWPRLRSRWEPARTAPDGPFTPFTPQERNAIWEHAARTAAEAAAHIRSAANPADAADAAWAAADTLRVAASALGSGELHRAAAAYDRASRCPYGRIPRATPAGNGLRPQAARLLSALSYVGDPGLAQLALVVRLAALIEDIADLRAAQRHAAQAAAARLAAEHRHAARTGYATRVPASRPRARTTADLARLGFPMPPITQRPTTPAGTSRAAQPGARPSRRPHPPRQRGPTR
jgi:hypothetical protein